MSNIKAAFFDIDGTLWKRGNPVPESAARAIKKFRDQGGLAFVCTGRSKGHVTDRSILDIGWDGMIYGCGTFISVGAPIGEDGVAADKCGPLTSGIVEDHDILHRVLIDNEEWERIIELCRTYKVRMIIEGDECLYYNHEDYDDDPYGQMLDKELGELRRTIDGERGHFIAGKFSVDIDHHELEDEWFNALSEKYDFIRHTAEIFEIVPKGYDKAFGMQKACEHFNIPLKSAAAFGDGYNDAKMINLAGCGIAMGSALDGVKAVADYVTAAAEDDGIEKAMIELGMI